jgi:uncharacterized protein YbjT (DUF2867 family)
MQNFVTHKAAHIHRGAVFEPWGDARISYVDVRDVAAVAARALLDPRHAGRAYELSGPVALSMPEALVILAERLGRAIQYISISELVARSAMIDNGAPSYLAEAVLELHRYYCSGAGAIVSDAVERITGRPPIDFERFAADYRESWR